VPQVNENATLEERINYILYSEINPSLASHGGEVSLIEVLDQETAVLQFGGGCQGCGMVDLTLKDGVEKSLIEQVSEIKKVIDVTDHTYRENAYYK
jgi:Fe/S biogenesis protein NfuA